MGFFGPRSGNNSAFEVDGVRFRTITSAQKARRKRAMKRLLSGKGIRSRLWKLFTNKKGEAKMQAEFDKLR